MAKIIACPLCGRVYRSMDMISLAAQCLSSWFSEKACPNPNCRQHLLLDIGSLLVSGAGFLLLLPICYLGLNFLIDPNLFGSFGFLRIILVAIVSLLVSGKMFLLFLKHFIRFT